MTVVRMTSFGIELTQEQIEFLKKRFNLTSNTQVRMFLENQARLRINRAIERNETDN